jgi:hypothetical protein
MNNRVTISVSCKKLFVIKALPHIWEFGNWLYHHDSAPAHWSLLVYNHPSISLLYRCSPCCLLPTPKSESSPEGTQVLISKNGVKNATMAALDGGHWKKPVQVPSAVVQPVAGMCDSGR